MKIKISKKKFYNKYDYKVTLKIEGCECLRYNSIAESKQFLENGTLPKFYICDHRKIKILENKQILINLCSTLLNYDSNSWQKRIEKNCIDVFSKEIDLVDDLRTNFGEIILTISEPSNDPAEPFTLKVKKLPNDRYRYRVFLLPHKLKHNEEEKERYISWIESQRSKIKMSDSVKNWFIKTQWNWDPRYVLVDEESTLLMLKLRYPELVGRVYKFVTD